MTSTLERARGRWHEILPQLGIDIRYLTNKHGPCPICGGKDRFRFDDRNGTGSFYCNQCGPGNGVRLINMTKGWDFKTICDEINKIIGNSPPKLKTTKDDSADRRREAIEKLLTSATSPWVVDDYLRGRGISVSSKLLCGIERCPYYNADGEFIGQYPAVVAPIVAPDRSLQSAQRIYIADVFPRKKTMPSVHTITGAAVRLQKSSEEMGVAEGVETALAAYELYETPTWAAVSAHGIETFVPPTIVRHLHVFADNDKSCTGQLAAYKLGFRLAKERPEIKFSVHIPPRVGTDFNDLLHEEEFSHKNDRNLE